MFFQVFYSKIGNSIFFFLQILEFSSLMSKFEPENPRIFNLKYAFGGASNLWNSPMTF